MTAAKLKPDEWMPFYVDKYLGDTTHLTLEQHAAYLLMLFTAWKRAGTLPDDDAQLINIAHMNARQWRASRAILRGFFQSDGAGGLVQKRLSAEIERAQTLIEKAEQRTQEVTGARSLAGLKGARSRWQTDGKPDGKTAFLPSLSDGKLPSDDGKTDSKLDSNCHETDGKTDGNAMAKRGDTGGSPIPASPPSVTPTSTEEEVALAPSSPRETSAGAACKAMREAGIAEVNPSNPTLIEMLRQGATVSEFHFAAVKAVDHGRGFAYALGVVKGDREAAARVNLAPKKRSPFALPPGHVSVLPDDLPSLEIEDENRTEESHVDDAARARG